MLIYETIKRRIKGFVRKDEMLKDWTSIKIGGPADVLVIPEISEDLMWLLALLREKGVHYFIMGNGTNLIFSDRGFRGVIIKTNRCFNEVKVIEDTIFSGSGVDLMRLILKSAECGFACLEPLTGIPGTVGGAIWMNAGAFGREVKDCIETVRYIDCKGSEREERADFSYRTSPFKKGIIITGARFSLQKRDKLEIMKGIEEIKRKRSEKQPLNLASAGSIFKNPDGKCAGEIIDRLGLKGMSVGDAEISKKHANFIINRGKATADDIKKLIERIRKKVREEEGVELELEVEFVEEK